MPPAIYNSIAKEQVKDMEASDHHQELDLRSETVSVQVLSDRNVHYIEPEDEIWSWENHREAQVRGAD